MPPSVSLRSPVASSRHNSDKSDVGPHHWCDHCAEPPHSGTHPVTARVRPQDAPHSVAERPAGGVCVIGSQHRCADLIRLISAVRSSGITVLDLYTPRVLQDRPGSVSGRAAGSAVLVPGQCCCDHHAVSRRQIPLSGTGPYWRRYTVACWIHSTVSCDQPRPPASRCWVGQAGVIACRDVTVHGPRAGSANVRKSVRGYKYYRIVKDCMDFC